MSHFTTIQTQVRDLDALRHALGELNVTLHEKTTARGYAGNQLQGDYVIRLKGPYDIALNQTPDGSYGLTTDWWDGHVERRWGPNSAACSSSTESTKPRSRPANADTSSSARRRRTARSN